MCWAASGRPPCTTRSGISPDGARILAEVGDHASNVDRPVVVSRGGRRGHAPDIRADLKEFAVWSPDGRTIAYSCGPGEFGDLPKVPTGPGTEERLVALDGFSGVVVVDWSPDGRYLSFNGKVTNPPHTEVGIVPARRRPQSRSASIRPAPTHTTASFRRMATGSPTSPMSPAGPKSTWCRFPGRAASSRSHRTAGTTSSGTPKGISTS